MIETKKIHFEIPSLPVSTNRLYLKFKTKMTIKNNEAVIFEELARYSIIKQKVNKALIDFDRIRADIFYFVHRNNKDVDNFEKNLFDSITNNRQNKKSIYVFEDDKMIFDGRKRKLVLDNTFKEKTILILEGFKASCESCYKKNNCDIEKKCKKNKMKYWFLVE
jgi:hypothetical protein